MFPARPLLIYKSREKDFVTGKEYFFNLAIDSASMDDFLNKWQEFVNDHSNRSFIVFYDRFYKDLLRIADSLIKNSGLRTNQPFDFVQDAFLKFLRRVRMERISFDSESKMWSYLVSILQHDIFKTIDRGPDLLMNRLDEEINDIYEEDSYSIQDGRSRIESTFFEDFFGYVRVFKKHYSQHNTECYRILNRLIIEEYSYQELIAMNDFAGYTYDSLRQRKHRCISDLRAFLDRYC